MYKQAFKMKLRFETIRGAVTVEDLFDIPLINTTKFSLDEIAKGVNRRLKECQEESFVEKKSVGNEELELKLAILKDIISDKLKEKEDAENAVARKAKKEKLMAIYEEQTNAELKQKSPEEIKKMIDEL